ncbi:DUF7882 family protein [Microbacterium sp. RD1]|uniref:DUF7882 family protein n=1 Tax=Microbacterium sp. RD1 TaxID=3457313 RepID=UPI003FA5AF52
MGHLYYGGSVEPIVIPDRLLAHIKVVLATKLRRNESFTFSWRDQAVGRSTIWVQPSIELRFVFGSADPEVLDPELLQQLAHEAAGTAGITVDLSAATEIPAPASSRR